MEKRYPDEKNRNANYQRLQWIAIFCLVVIGLIALGISYYRYEAQRIVDDKYEDISVIAKLKADSIQDWRRQRLADVHRVAVGPLVRKEMARLLHDPMNTSARAALHTQLNINRKNNIYADALFLDARGGILLSDNPNPVPVGKATMKAIEIAFKERKEGLSDLFRDPQNIIYIDAVAPIPDNSGQSMAIVVLRRKAENFLYPLIQTWPTPSKTAETLLVRRDGDSILFLNELRHRSNTALNLRIPLINRTLPAVQTVLGKYNRLDGKDYRGVNVLAIGQPILQSPWFIVSKVDEKEILKEVRYRAWVIFIIVALLILIAAALISLIYRKQREDERKQAEEALRETEERFAAAFHASPNLIAITRMADGKIVDINEGYSKLLGYSHDESIDKTTAELSIWANPADRAAFVDMLEKFGEINDFETILQRKDGTLVTVIDSAKVIELHGEKCLLSVAHDITERKKYEESLHNASLYTRSLIEASLDPLVTINPEGKITDVNKATEIITGISREQLVGSDFADYFTEPEKARAGYQQVLSEGLAKDYPLTIRHTCGSMIDVLYNATVYKNEAGQMQGVFAAARDITERRRAEVEIARVNRALRMLSSSNQALIHVVDETTLLNEICRIVVDVGGYHMAWVGLAEHDEAKTVRPVASAGFDSGYIESVNITWADIEHGHGPGGTAIRTGQPCIARNIPQDPAFAPWREAAIQRGYKSNIALPLISEGQTLGELAIYSVEVDAFDAQEVEILRELADDLAFGITAQRMRVKREQTEVALRDSEERYRLIAENTADTIAVFDLNFNPTYISPSILKLRGLTVEEAMTQTLNQILTPDSLQQASKMFTDQMALESSGTADPARTALIELEEYCKDGSTIWVELAASFLRDNYFKPTGILTVTRDTTERKKAEEALRLSEEKYRSILEDIREGYFEVNFAGNFTFFNDSLRRFLGYSKEELMGMNSRQYTDQEHSKKLFQAFNKVYNTGKPAEGFDWQIIRKDGTKRYVEASVSFQKDSSGKPIGFRGIARDVTDRKKSEEALKNSEAKYRNIFENAVEGIYQSTIDGRFITANAALARMAGYDSPEEFIESITDIGTQLYVHPENRKRLVEIMEAKGFVEGFEVEFYKKDGSTFWVVINARTVKDERGEILNVEGLIEDITIRKQAEEQLHQTIDSLKQAVGTTIHVLSMASEARDPYTAGHQKRVADLASAIAMEMGLPDDKIEGLRMAGSIHDIGKISVPAEILSKPTKLTNTEYSIIKEHSESGYNMLKDVKSSWPLAQIVYQHHERMNGSGYPRNLKGNEILLEARILAVADVVEAMGSHRPYRPTLGTEAALEEITKNKGILYDNTVADACLKLFREKGYQLT